ncbi:myosin IC heavy chain-like [Haemorhous mexicanus]|uniref:myosin IC heavy chain-like n=1 Tax=Haemorhous mexicanus TaxID=30427 RepID=UPI0028BF4C79|nr:myosin IC heavy chain-like [Haemorhous mexicanus]
MEVHLSQPPAPFAEAGNGFNRRLAKADGTTEGKTPTPQDTRTIRVLPALPSPLCPGCPGRGAAALAGCPGGRCAARPGGTAISSPLALSGGAPTRAGAAGARTGLAPPPQSPRPRLSGSRGTLMRPSPAFHPWGEKPALGRGREMNPFAFVRLVSRGWV